MKSNKKQIISILAVLTMAVLLSCALVACDKAGTDKTGTDIAADYKVTIHPNNGQSDIVWDITKEIPTITKDGFHIAGYFLDAQLTISTTLESLKATGITKNIDVYVKWEEHVESIDAAVDPTCTEKGLTEGKRCSKCGKILQAQNEIPALGHDLEHHDGQPATCTEKGWEEYVTCKREGCEHTTYEEIPALDHTGGTATCTEQATCERCNEKYGNALGHKYGDLIPKTEPTCSATGVEEHYKCSACDKVFKNDEHKTETTLDDLTIAINPAAHNFGEWIKNEGADTHTRVCSFNNEHAETENCHGGTATCTEQAVCEKCNAKYGELANHDYKNGVCTVCGIRLPSEGLEYSLNSDETGYTVTGIGSCTDTEIIIPSKHNAKPVTSIGERAFNYCDSLTSVTIGNSVTSIGNYAFSGCTGLTSVTIPDSVTSIGDYAFYNCTGLTSITIPNSVTSIGSSAFSDCSGLTSIIVDEGNTKYHSAGNCLIETATKTLILGCKTSVIPADGSVTSIGRSAFSGCTGLTSVTIGNSVTSIGDCAFDGCKGLTSVTIPDSVTSIGWGAFRGCTGLAKIIGSSSVVSSVAKQCNSKSFEVVITSGTSIGWCAFLDCTGLKSVTIGNGVTSIDYSAFSGCTWLTSITIPDSVTSIGEDAFYNTAWYYNQPSGLVYAGKVAYKYKGTMPNNTSIVLKEGTLGIADSAFEGCTGLTSITIPDSVTSIGYNAFNGCTGLSSITIPDNVTSIGNYAFRNCTGLTSVVIPDSVTSIGGGAFEGCTGLTSITIPDNVTSIGYSAFFGCTGLTSITIPDSVTSIGQQAFSGCSGLTSIIVNERNTNYYSAENCLIETATNTLILGCKTSVIPTDGSVTSIGEDTFKGCSGLKSVTIPDSVTSIGGGAFAGCICLTSVTIPDSVTSIGDQAFYDCSGLTSVTIGNGVTSIGERVFSGCSSLESITIPFVGAKAGVTSSDTYQYPFGYIFGTSSYDGGVATEQYYYGSSTSSTTNTTYYIPSSLKSVAVTGGNILYGAFSGCTGLTSVTIGNGVTSIGMGAFYNCTGLTSITIPDSVTSIGAGAFFDCTGLTSIIVDEGNTKYHSAGNCLIETATNTLILGCKTSVIPTDGSVTSIGDYAFQGCTGLTSITIPDSVTSICSSAFEGCTGLTSVTIPDSVTSIGNYAFEDCTSLTNIKFNGTIAQWSAVSKETNWKTNVPATEVVCTDGKVSI